MSVLIGKTLGKEQLILLPVDPHDYDLTTAPPQEPVTLSTGRHGIVVSGYAGIHNQPNDPVGVMILPGSGDDKVEVSEVNFLVGPAWLKIVQVSASVSPAGIYSLDSDEVDHSRWIVEECTWAVAKFPAQQEEKIRLTVKLHYQGEENGWHNLAYQVVATGILKRMPTLDEISAELP
jgi:hypothetical protein